MVTVNAFPVLIALLTAFSAFAPLIATTFILYFTPPKINDPSAFFPLNCSNVAETFLLCKSGSPLSRTVVTLLLLLWLLPFSLVRDWTEAIVCREELYSLVVYSKIN